MRKHKQNHHTGDVARSNMNTADSSVPDIDAKLKNHKNDDMETADKCQSCKKKFADNTLKYHRPFKIDATVETTADTQIPLDEEIASDREGRNAAVSNGKYSSGQFMNEETAHNTRRNVAKPENDTIIDTNLKDDEMILNTIGKFSSGQSVDEHEATFTH